MGTGVHSIQSRNVTFRVFFNVRKAATCSYGSTREYHAGIPMPFIIHSFPPANSHCETVFSSRWDFTFCNYPPTFLPGTDWLIYPRRETLRNRLLWIFIGKYRIRFFLKSSHYFLIPKISPDTCRSKTDPPDNLVLYSTGGIFRGGFEQGKDWGYVYRLLVDHQLTQLIDSSN